VKELIDEVGTFFLAGTDTTSTLTTNLLFTLSKHPEIITKMRK
jgi:cytochrome P450